MISERKSIAGGLAFISHEQILPGQRRRVPGLLVEDRKSRQFAQLLWIGVDQNHVARLGGHEQQIAHENFLAVTVAALLPFQLAIGRIYANHNPIIKAVNESVAMNYVGELGFKAIRFPELCGGELSFRILRNFYELAACPITARYKYTIIG